MTRRRISAYQIAISDNWLVYLVRSGDKETKSKHNKQKENAGHNKLTDTQHQHQQRGQQRKQAN